MSGALADLLTALPAHSPFAFALASRRWHRLDLGASNPRLGAVNPADARAMQAWIERECASSGADHAAGGYGEDRALYRMSAVFDSGRGEEARTLHLGIDLWLAAGTPVHAVLPGVVHSTADNAAFGDYGATVILEHTLGGWRFYTLYGHLARASLAASPPGRVLAGGEPLGWLGEPAENGGWAPHLHLQVLSDMSGRQGDHPGVCKPSERAHWLAQCPDPNRLLRLPALEAAP
ncbi:MAG TPA: peptidoglycan DD-metalloendopeptidase family protein [Nevskiaceae bacterium]|nr:peptidoglycan DD-metalloendopeptidase family protein [Nevskiaceae bacterium]